MRLIGYGGMLTESFVAIMALITASILDQHLYFAINAPAAQTGGTAATAAHVRQRARPVRRPCDRRPDQPGRQRRRRARRSCRAPAGRRRWRSEWPTYCNRVFGGASLKAFWYHFAIMFEALFILTTVDAGTRVARFMLSDGLGNLGGPLARLRNPSWRVGRWVCSIAWWRGVGQHPADGRDRSAGRNQHAVPAVRHRQPAARGDRADGRHRGRHQEGPAEVGVDSRNSVAVGSGRHVDGVVAEDLLRRTRPSATGHSIQYSAAKQAGKTAFGAAKNAHQLDEVVRNTFIQGTLSILFALVVVIVVIAGVVVASGQFAVAAGAAERG